MAIGVDEFLGFAGVCLFEFLDCCGGMNGCVASLRLTRPTSDVWWEM